MQRQWQGFYLDGQSASRYPITVHLTGTDLHFRAPDGRQLSWPYRQIRQTQGAYEGEQVRLEYGDPLPQTIIVQDAKFLADLHQAASTKVDHLHDSRQRNRRLQWTVMASLALLGVTAGMYFWGIPAAAKFLASHVPPSWERQLGDSALEHMASVGRRCTDPDRLAAIERVLGQLTAAAPDSRYHIQVTIIDKPVVNAFALPGGHVILLRGLLEATETPEQLAGVLAHELQHIYKQHSTRAILEQGSTSLLIAAVTGDVTGALAFGIESARALGMLRYSRLHEDEADRQGLHLLKVVGVDPAEMIAFYRTLGATHPSQGEIPSYLATHPRTEDRIAEMTRLADPPPARPVSLLPGKDWKDIRSMCGHRLVSPDVESQAD